MAQSSGAGVVIGRFMPPHAGHQYLIRFAQSYCNDVHILVCTLHDEPIPGELRYRWMRELFPTAHVIHVTEEIPEASRSARGAQAIWADAIRSRIDVEPRYVFASEPYGLDLARELGAQFVPVDPRRETFPISAGMIRENPMAHWNYLPPVVRPYFARKVAVVDSTGRLAPELARLYETVLAADYVSYVTSLEHAKPGIGTLEELLRGQVASEAALLHEAYRILFTGVEPLHYCLESGLSLSESNRIVDELRRREPTASPALIVSADVVSDEYRRAVSARGWQLVEAQGALHARELTAERVDRWLIGTSR